MAAPATHIILAKLIKEKYFSQIDDQSYYIGTSFADIRYIASIDRNATHFYDIHHPTDITDTDPFMIGLKVHSLVDEIRHNYMTDHNLYEIIPNEKLPNQIMKVYEDIMLYDEIADWTIFSDYLDDLIQNEKEFNIPIETLERWHKIIKFCISKKPNDEMAVKFLGSKLQNENDNEIIETLNSLRNNQKVQNLIYDFYESFKRNI